MMFLESEILLVIDGLLMWLPEERNVTLSDVERD